MDITQCTETWKASFFLPTPKQFVCKQEKVLRKPQSTRSFIITDNRRLRIDHSRVQTINYCHSDNDDGRMLHAKLSTYRTHTHKRIMLTTLRKLYQRVAANLFWVHACVDVWNRSRSNRKLRKRKKGRRGEDHNHTHTTYEHVFHFLVYFFFSSIFWFSLRTECVYFFHLQNVWLNLFKMCLCV